MSMSAPRVAPGVASGGSKTVTIAVVDGETGDSPGTSTGTERKAQKRRGTALKRKGTCACVGNFMTSLCSKPATIRKTDDWHYPLVRVTHECTCHASR